MSKMLTRNRAAVEEGIVPGGGVALLRLQCPMTSNWTATRVGVTIVHRACEEPVRKIVLNRGTEGAVVVEKIKTSANATWLQRFTDG